MSGGRDRGAGPAPGTHRDLGVSVQRDLTGGGRLARGGSTRFSSIRFRSVGTPASPEGDAPAEVQAAAPPAGAAPAASEPAAAPAPRRSPLRALLKWLGLG